MKKASASPKSSPKQTAAKPQAGVPALQVPGVHGSSNLKDEKPCQVLLPGVKRQQLVDAP